MKKFSRRFQTVPLAEVLARVSSKRRERTVLKLSHKEDPYSVHSKDEGSRGGSSTQSLQRHRWPDGSLFPGQDKN